MFFSSPQKMETQAQWKVKQQKFMKESVKKDRDNIIQSQRYLNSVKIIEWHVNINMFKITVSSTFNYFSLIKTLFAISQEVNWRNYVPHMEILISTFHNIMSTKKGANIQDITKIDNFEAKFGQLLLRKDISLHKHLTLLLKMLLVFNSKYLFINEQNFSEILVDSINYDDIQIIKQTLWLLAQTKVSSLALSKLCKYQNLHSVLQKDQSCLLAFLTLLANFLSNPKQNQNIVQLLVKSDSFQKAFNLGIFSNKKQIINETILIFNNGICFSLNLRNRFLQHYAIINRIMSQNCKQAQKCRQILKILDINYDNLHNRMNIEKLKLNQNSFIFTSSSQTAME